MQEDRQVAATAQSTPTGVDRAQADVSPTAAIDGADQRVDVDVAVIDTGVDLDHPDLNVNRSGAKNCTLFGLGSADDDHGHGSHVAGTIGALDNTTGVVGVAPGARIWPVKVLNAAGSGTTADVVCGIDYVAAHADQIEVANMSLGGGGEDDGNCGATNDDAQHAAICEAVANGVTFVVAAGNDSADASALDARGVRRGDHGQRARRLRRPARWRCAVDLPQRPGRHLRVVLQLRQRRRHHRARRVHRQHVDAGRVRHPLRHLDGLARTSPAVPRSTPPRTRVPRPRRCRTRCGPPARPSWNDADDPDNTKEPLLDVSTY